MVQFFEGKYDEILTKIVWSSTGDGVSRRMKFCCLFESEGFKSCV